MATSQEGATMTARQQQRREAETAHALDKTDTKGLMDGYTAASVHAPEFLSMRALMQAAREISYARQDTLSPAQQDEYFVGWVRGYVRRTNEAQDLLDTWEDEGGALTGSWHEAEA
jgi:hypothetical protein